jgi:16S rRNA (guanine527-N7)-methyltransferase
MLRLQVYVELLMAANKQVNLISRQTTEDELWLNHILDSLLPVDLFDLNGRTVLDLGSGGGLPGIPLKIIFPDSYFYLLDSRQRKMEAVKKIIKKLDLPDCLAICSRMEELDDSWQDYFDVLVCRSVKIIPRYWDYLAKLLNASGKLYFYKGKKFDDVENLNNIIRHDVSHPQIGTRNLIELKKEDVPRGT